MEGADLYAARMEGADLRQARMDASTNLTDALLRGASVRFVEFTDIDLSQDQVDQMFGDGSVTLPEGLTRPANWPDWELDGDEFDSEWRRWQDDPLTYTPPQERK